MRPCCHLRSYVFLQNEQEVAFILHKKLRWNIWKERRAKQKSM